MFQQGPVHRNQGVRRIGFSDKIWRGLARSECRNLVIKSGCFEELLPMLGQARKYMNLAGDYAISAMMEANPSVLQQVEDHSGGKVETGLVGFLPLSLKGYQAVLDGSFSGATPDPSWVVHQGETPVALYFWLVFMPGSFARLMGAYAAALEPYLSVGVPIFSRATNPHSHRLQKAAGFIEAIELFPGCAPEMLVVLPEKQLEAPRSPKLDISIARSVEEIFQVFSVRSATYIAEQFCLYEEEFDGNDFCSTHFLGKIDGDVAGCVRLRFFNGFAKLERLAVRAEYRQSRLAYQLVRAALEHCRRKGYDRVLGHSRLDLVRFWKVFGFVPVEDRPPFSFANVQYVEILLQQEPSPEALGIDADPMVIIRPEGAWERPGVFDKGLSAFDPRRKQLLEQRTRTVGRQKIVS